MSDLTVTEAYLRGRVLCQGWPGVGVIGEALLEFVESGAVHEV